MNAWTLNALPILANQSPYEDVEKLGLGLLCNNTEDWYENLRRAISDPTLASDIRVSLDRFVTENYSGKQNLEVLRLISQECPAPGTSVIDNRYRLYIDEIKKDRQQSENWESATQQSDSRFEAFIRRYRSWLLPANSPQERLARFVFKLFKNEPLPGTTWNPLMARGIARLTRILEYTVHPHSQNWTGIEFMIGTLQKRGTGQIHIEILDKSADNILRKIILDLGEVFDNQIVNVEFDAIRDAKDKEFTVRFLLKNPGAETSIHIYERNSTEARLRRILRRIGLLTRGNALACNLLYSDQ